VTLNTMCGRGVCVRSTTIFDLAGEKGLVQHSELRSDGADCFIGSCFYLGPDRPCLASSVLALAAVIFCFWWIPITLRCSAFDRGSLNRYATRVAPLLHSVVFGKFEVSSLAPASLSNF
jgi:hypothetical protein